MRDNLAIYLPNFKLITSLYRELNLLSALSLLLRFIYYIYLIDVALSQKNSEPKISLKTSPHQVQRNIDQLFAMLY